MSQILVIFGGPSPEHDVSVLTGLQVVRELDKHHDTIGVYWSKTNEWYRVSNDLEAKAFAHGLPSKAEKLELVVSADGCFRTSGGGPFGRPHRYRPDAAVICCHGGPGEAGMLQGALDLCAIPYTGPTATSAAVSMDKFAFAAAVAAVGLPTLPRVVLTEELDFVDFEAPFLVKPRFGGSSIGIEIVDSLQTAKMLLKSSPHMKWGAVIEPFIAQSVDLNVAVRTYPELLMSEIEKPLRADASKSANSILGYKDKYVGEAGMVNAPREFPAQIDPMLADTIRTLAGTVARVFKVRGVQRIDFLAHDDAIYVNEINSIPGSLSKHLLAPSGVSFENLLDEMINEARHSPTCDFITAGSDGSALSAAGTIAGKLA